MAQTAIQKLQEIADIFNVESARISGDPKRLQATQNQISNRKLIESNNIMNDAIDELEIDQIQKDFIKSLDPVSKYESIFGKTNKTKNDFIVEILEKIQAGIPLTETDQKLLDTIRNTDPLQSVINAAVSGTLGGTTPTQIQNRTYNTGAEVQADIEVGIVKPGDIINYRGERMEVVNPPNK